MEQCEPVTYRLQLPEILSVVHNIFHVSQLKKCLCVPTEAVKIEGLQVQPDTTYLEHPIKILDRKELSYSKLSGQVLQGAMDQPHRSGSCLGAGGLFEETLPPPAVGK